MIMFTGSVNETVQSSAATALSIWMNGPTSDRRHDRDLGHRAASACGSTPRSVQVYTAIARMLNLGLGPECVGPASSLTE